MRSLRYLNGDKERRGDAMAGAGTSTRGRVTRTKEHGVPGDVKQRWSSLGNRTHPLKDLVIDWRFARTATHRRRTRVYD